MKKITITIIFLIINFLSIESHAFDYTYSCGLGSLSGSYTTAATCTWGEWSTTTWVVQNIYDNSAEAWNAATTYASTLTTGTGYTITGPSYITSFFSANQSTTNISTGAWRGVQVTHTLCSNTSGRWIHVNYWLYPNPNWVDENSDCISDEAPNEDDYFHVSGSITNAAGTCFYYARLFTSNGNFADYGDSSAFSKMMNGDLDGTIHYYDDYPLKNSDTGDYMFSPLNTFANVESVLPACDYTGGLVPSGEDPNSGSPEDTNISENKDLADGQDSTGNTTELENQQDIADNTADIANNQQIMSDQLTEIANQIKAQRNDLKDKAKADSEAYDKMNDKLGDLNSNFNYSGAETAYNALNSDLDAFNKELYKTEAEFNGTDEYSTALNTKINEISEDGTVGTMIDSHIDDSLLNGIRNSSVTASGDCSVIIPFEVWGHSGGFELNACRFSNELATIGNLFYVVTVIGCFVMILRGR